MNSTVDYEQWTSLIRQMVGLRMAYAGRGPRIDILMAEAQRRWSARIEAGIARQLQASGVAPAVAQRSALCFLSQAVEGFCGRGVGRSA